MRVALCLSGQPRNALNTYNLINENIIKPNNCDVFMYLNYDENNLYVEKFHKDNGNCHLKKNIDKRLIDLYKPVKVLVEKQKEFINPDIQICEKRTKNVLNMNKKFNWSEEETKKHDLKCVYSMFYGIYKCNEIKELYSLEKGFVYDYVIRLRYDVAPRKKIKFSEYDPNFIYYQNLKQPDDIISDWFNFGSNTIMNIYSSLFLHLHYINSYKFYKKESRIQKNELYNADKCIYGPEHMIRDLMNLFNIEKKSVDFNVTF